MPDLSPAMQSSLVLMDSIIDHGVALLDLEGRVQYWNPGAVRLFQHTFDEAIGQPIDLIFTPPDCAAFAPRIEREIALRDGVAPDFRWHQRRDGSLIWVDGSMSPVRDASGSVHGFVKVMHDGTDRKRYEAEIVRLARVDPLTGLGNRFAFAEQLAALTESTSRHGLHLVVQLIDLDRFKDVNDRLGHAAGDAVLKEAASRICDAVRKTDFVARLGGDEFVVLQSDLTDARDAERVADCIAKSLAQPIDLDGEQVSISASIGLAVFPTDADDLDQLVRIADAAMYGAKKQFGGGYHFARRGMDKDAHQRSCDRASLKRALAETRMELHYQPQVNSTTGRIEAVEALIRFTDPALAHLNVDEALSLARSAGLMRDIGHWVLETACRQAREWRDMGAETLKVCVNLCADEMGDPGLPGKIEALLAEVGLPESMLEIELTERQIFDYTRQEPGTLERLRRSRITLAIDDFGTGYSALSYLLRLPVDRIKLDRTFVQHVPHDQQSCALARAVVALAHIMSLPVVVEGVESQDQADFFRAEGCEAMQGYFFGRPLPPDEISRMLAVH